MPHTTAVPVSFPVAAIRGLAFGTVGYAVAAGIRLAAVGNILPRSVLYGVGTYPVWLFTGADARIGFGLLVLGLVCSLPFAPLRRNVIAVLVALLTSATSHFASVVIPYLFLSGVVPLPDLLRTPYDTSSVHPWLRVLLFSALVPLAFSVCLLIAARIFRASRQPHSPA